METQIITSIQNDKIKLIRSLKQKQNRDKLNLFLAEGEKIVRDALSAGMIAADIFVHEDKEEKFHSLLSSANENNIRINTVSEKIMAAISQTKSPQGIAASFYKRKNVFSLDVFNNSKFIGVLEEIRDPGNLGTIIRTCDAVGVDSIIMENCTDLYNNKVIRSSMGSIFNIPCYNTSLHECIPYMKDIGWQIGCGHLKGGDFYNRSQGQKIALVIGNEARGISSETANMCTDLWKLPMHGKADSLNASVAAGIMLYDIQNKLS